MIKTCVEPFWRKYIGHLQQILALSPILCNILIKFYKDEFKLIPS